MSLLVSLLHTQLKVSVTRFSILHRIGNSIGWESPAVWSHLSIVGCLAAQHKTSSDQNVNQPSHLDVYLDVGSAFYFAIGAVPANFWWSKPKASISGMSILKTSPLSQGSIKSSISSPHMLSNYLICRAMCFSTIYNAFFKARNWWKHRVWRLFFRDEEPFSPAAVSSPRPAKLLDTRKDQLQIIPLSRIGMKVLFAFQ